MEKGHLRGGDKCHKRKCIGEFCRTALGSILFVGPVGGLEILMLNRSTVLTMLEKVENPQNK